MEFFAAGGFQQLLSDLQQPLMAPDELDLNYGLFSTKQNQNQEPEQDQESDFLNNYNESVVVPVASYGSSESNQNYMTPEAIQTDYCYEDVSFCNLTTTSSTSATGITPLPNQVHIQAQDPTCDYYGIITLDQLPQAAVPATPSTMDSDMNNNDNNSTYQYLSTLVLDPDTDTDSYSSSYGGVFGTADQDQFTDWENRFLDSFIEIPELVDLLPEKTPLCTDMCDYFLQESSNNLKLPETLTDEVVMPPVTTETLFSLSTPISITVTLPESPGTTTITTTLTDKGYPCTYGNCQKIYAKPAHLKAHLRRHLGEKPYICKWPGCSWKFSRSDELARHGRSHSGVKPYKCDYCGKCFARSDHLTKHRKVHERRLLAASRAGKLMDNVMTQSIYTVRPGRKRKNQLC